MDFVKSATAPEIRTDRAYYFGFSRNDILVIEDSPDHLSIPCIHEKTTAKMKLDGIRFIGRYNSTDCYCARIRPENLPEGYQLANLRSLYGKVDMNFWSISGYARQIHDWNLNFQFCGRCGQKTHPEKNEHARVCHDCGLTGYPRISPAIITAVVKDNRILLARGINFPNKNMFSVLAGFVSPGETLEDCVRREIYEETGIRIKNIQYFKSQSWPFPDSLMIGFTAEYAGGSISIDPDEILEAGWFTKDNLPLIPGKQSLAGELIEWFVNSQTR
ncbi:MAG: NAD(+) diphosphatase [Desulfobacula sp.]|jgi:NAD+ diphosphatase